MSPKRLFRLLQILRPDKQVGSTDRRVFPPALSDLIIDSIPASSSFPFAICASAVDGNVETAMRSEGFIASHLHEAILARTVSKVQRRDEESNAASDLVGQFPLRRTGAQAPPRLSRPPHHRAGHVEGEVPLEARIRAGARLLPCRREAKSARGDAISVATSFP